MQNCFESASNLYPAPASPNFKNDDAKEAKFKHFCRLSTALSIREQCMFRVSGALTKCWNDCDASEIRDDFLNYTQGLLDSFCDVSNGFNLFEGKMFKLSLTAVHPPNSERGKAINECLRKGKVMESAITALLFSGGNSSRVPAENLCEYAFRLLFIHKQ